MPRLSLKFTCFVALATVVSLADSKEATAQRRGGFGRVPQGFRPTQDGQGNRMLIPQSGRGSQAPQGFGGSGGNYNLIPGGSRGSMGPQNFNQGFNSGFGSSFGNRGGIPNSGFNNSPQNFGSSFNGGFGNSLSTVPSNSVPSSSFRQSPPQNFSNRPIKIVCPDQYDGTVGYLLNDYTYHIRPGESQRLTEDRSWTIRFDRGGDFGTASYRIRPGTYTFRPSDRGWELYRSGDFVN